MQKMLQHSDIPSQVKWNHTIRWPSIDETTDGFMNFHTIVDIDPTNFSTIPREGINRLVCMFVVNQLHGDSLHKACEELVDIYSWQKESNTVPLEAPKQTRHSVTNSRSATRVPFVVGPE
jgi:hypothetical protein